MSEDLRRKRCESHEKSILESYFVEYQTLNPKSQEPYDLESIVYRRQEFLPGPGTSGVLEKFP